MQSEVFRLMRDISKTKYNLSSVKDRINYGERRYCAITEYSVLENTNTNTAAGIQEYALPSDYSSLIAAFYKGDELALINIRDTIKTTPDSGPPTMYYIRNAYIGLEPTPIATETLTLIYNSIGGGLAADGDTPIIPIEHHMLPVFWACYMCSIEGDDNRATTFLNNFIGGLGQAVTEDVSKAFPQWPVVNEDTIKVESYNHDIEGVF